jgi:uncharacterized membrane protein
LALVKGSPGHPLHPPLTDATIGAYTLALLLGILAAAGVAEDKTSAGWWLALVAGLGLTVPTALTGFVDWLSISRGTPLWRVATSHLVAMVTAAGLFLVTAVVGHADYADDTVSGGPLALTVVGFAFLTLGGWLGGTIVFVYGMRVRSSRDVPAMDAASPAVDQSKAA